MPFTRRSLIRHAAAGAGALSLVSIGRTSPSVAQSDPMAAAEQLSFLETNGNIDTLYNRMHPDAQAIIPRWAVVSWYREEFLPLEPEPAISIGVRYVSWTWEVTGVSYDNTAEVSFIQEFGDGTEIEDVVRLVEVDGEWRWFFGRTRAFVEETIERFYDEVFPRQTGVVPYDLDTVASETYHILLDLPLRLEHANGPDAIRPDVGAFTTEPPDFAEAAYSISYQVEDDVYITAGATAFILKPGLTPGEAIEQIIAISQNAPLFRVLAWNLEPPNDVPYAHYTLLANDAVGTAEFLLWGTGIGDTLFMLTAVDPDDLEVMAAGLTSAR